MKKLMSITLVIALVLAQAGMAKAFTQKGTAGPFTASIDLSTAETPVGKVAASVKNIDGTAPPSEIGWGGSVTLGSGWTKSPQYLEVAYIANEVGWGVQVYTDNTNGTLTTDFQYGGDPDTDPAQQPAGLIGETNSFLTCPLAILTTDDTLTDTQLATPVQDTPSDPGSYFVSGYNKVDTTGDPGSDDDPYEVVWFFMKDLEGTVWEDDNSDGDIDAGEIKKTFNYPTGYGVGGGSDDYATVVNTMGISSGWVHETAGTMQRAAGLGDKDLTITATPAYSLNMYFAANFSNANELQEYGTETITLEVYVE